MARLRKAFNGHELRSVPSGFPIFYHRSEPRIVTADVWAFFKHMASLRLNKAQEKKAIAFIEQAAEFFDAARSPRIGSRPLLYYYAFMNLSKAFLLIRKVSLPVRLRHGLSDPQANSKKRVRFEGQRIQVPGRAKDKSELFPELLTEMGENPPKYKSIKLLDLLRQMPGIHRTYCKVTGEVPVFLPFLTCQLLSNDKCVVARLTLHKKQRDTKVVLKQLKSKKEFKSLFHQVQSCNPQELWFESEELKGRKRGIDLAVKRLSGNIQSIGSYYILTDNGYRQYLTSVKSRQQLHQLASTYCAMFYLGSITRYKPYDFDVIVAGKYSWLISEFMTTQPLQFIYGLAGQLAGVEVIRPFGIME